jgi:hypothetical protein
MVLVLTGDPAGVASHTLCFVNDHPVP